MIVDAGPVIMLTFPRALGDFEDPEVQSFDELAAGVVLLVLKLILTRSVGLLLG